MIRQEGQSVFIDLAPGGLDEGFSQRIHARRAYAVDDIVWDKRFADVLSAPPDGRRQLDYRRFHEVVDA